jgi:hypothetical protein
MTKQEFLSGKVFKLADHSYSNTYQFIPSKSKDVEGFIQRNIMSSDGDRVILFDHEANITKIGSKTFEIYSFVMSKRVQLKYRFDELI